MAKTFDAREMRARTVPRGVESYQDDLGPTSPGSVNPTSTKKPSRDEQIFRRDHVIRENALPNIGSFSLIKDIVRDYTDLSKGQQKEK